MSTIRPRPPGSSTSSRLSQRPAQEVASPVSSSLGRQALQDDDQSRFDDAVETIRAPISPISGAQARSIGLVPGSATEQAHRPVSNHLPTESSTEHPRAMTLAIMLALHNNLRETAEIAATCRAMIGQLQTLTSAIGTSPETPIPNFVRPQQSENSEKVPSVKPEHEGTQLAAPNKRNAEVPNLHKAPEAAEPSPFIDITEEQKTLLKGFATFMKQSNPDFNSRSTKNIFDKKFYGKSDAKEKEKTSTPRTISKDYDRYIEARARADKKSDRITKLRYVRATGSFETSHQAMQMLRRSLPEDIFTGAAISVDRISPDFLEKLNPQILSIFVSLFLPGRNCRIYILDNEGIETKNGNALIKSLNSRKPPSSDAKIVTMKIPESKFAKTSGAVVFAITALQQGKYNLFADIVAAGPSLIMKMIDDLPFEGNLFTTRAIATLFSRITNSDPNAIYTRPMSEEQDALDGLELAIRQYFRFSPVTGLVRHIPALLMRTRKGTEKNDLLFQDHQKFLHEVKTLAFEIIKHPERLQIADETERNRVCGRQVAILMGNAFGYGAEFLDSLKKDQKKLGARIGTATDFFKIAVGAGATAGGAPGPSVEALGKGESLLSEKMVAKATEPGRELDIPALQKDLVYLTKQIAELARSGHLIAGAGDISAEDFAALPKTERDSRLNLGGEFARIYEQQLDLFETHYLSNKMVRQ